MNGDAASKNSLRLLLNKHNAIVPIKDEVLEQLIDDIYSRSFFL